MRSINDTAIFTETQRFAPWVYQLAFGSTVAALIGAYFAARGMPDRDLLVAMMALVLVVEILLLRSLKLTTVVFPDAVEVNGFLVVNWRIHFSEIESAEMRQYKPIHEYGGWGYRIGASGRAYNARGDEGAQLILKSGERVMIGSQRAMELAAAISARLSR